MSTVAQQYRVTMGEEVSETLRMARATLEPDLPRVRVCAS